MMLQSTLQTVYQRGMASIRRQLAHDVRVLRLRPHGMFSNVNEVVEQLRLAEKDNYKFILDWRSSCYLDSDRSGDPWEYYFRPIFPGLSSQKSPKLLPVLATGRDVVFTAENIITPRRVDGESQPMLLPRDRTGAHCFIEQYLHLKSGIQRELDEFYSANFQGYVIGLHLRGPGKLRDGSGRFGNLFATAGVHDCGIYFDKVDTHLALHPNARIFACTDSADVVAKIEAKYPGRAFFYPASRSAFGEMHAEQFRVEAPEFNPYKLGKDVLLEAYLLSRTDYFVHGNSNVSNFVLCKSPLLEHVDVHPVGVE